MIALLLVCAMPAFAQTPTQDQYGQPVPPPNTPQGPGTTTTPPTGTDTTTPPTTNTPGDTATPEDTNTDDDSTDGSGGGTGDDSCNVSPAVSSAGVSDTCPEEVPAADPAAGNDSGGNLPIADSSDGLPYTGLALGALVLLACLMLAAGLIIYSVQRWLGRRTA